MFIVIVGAAVAGIIGMIGIATKSSADPLIRKQALSIAEAMLEEVRLQPFTYCDPDDPSAATATAGSGSGSIAFVAAQSQGTTTTTLTIAKPTGTAQNNVLIASIAFRPQSGETSNNVTVTPPAGWTQLDYYDSGSSYNALAIYYRVAGASEPASYAWGFACNGSCTFQAAAGGILTFSGVDTTNPIDQHAGTATYSTYNPKTPAVTTTVANTMLVTTHAIGNNDSWASPPPSGMTQVFQKTTNAEMIQVSRALQAAAGSTGQKQATDSGPDATDDGHAHILALTPGPGGGCPVLSEGMGPEPGETRYSLTQPFDNVNDYQGFDSGTAVPSGIRNLDGTLIPGLDGYRVTVDVAAQPFGGIGNDTNGNPQSLLITVTVTGPGNTTVAVSGYRTRYAPNALP